MKKFDQNLEKIALDNTLPDEVQNAADLVLLYREQHGQVDYGELSEEDKKLAKSL